MAELNPLNNELVLKLKEYDTRLSALEKSRQPYLGDWNDLNSSDFTYLSPTEIGVSNLDIDTFFQVGDRIRIKQATYKYFYISEIKHSSIVVQGGSAYSVANVTISEFAYSRISAPSGMGSTLAYTPTATPSTGSTSGITGYFTMNGNLVQVINRFTWASPGGASYVDVTIPFIYGGTGSDVYYQAVPSVYGGFPILDSAQLDTFTYGNNYIHISGTHTGAPTLTYSYIFSYLHIAP